MDPDTYKDCRAAVNAAELQAPRVIAPLSGENLRLVSQRGIFTKYVTSEPLEEWVKRYFAKNSEPILLKIDIANCQRGEALRWLDAANLNYLSLFPDVYGAAGFANSKV